MRLCFVSLKRIVLLIKIQREMLYIQVGCKHIFIFSCSTLVELNIYWVLVKLVKLVWSRENNNMNAGTFFSLKTLLHFNALTSHHNQTYPFTMSFDIKFEPNHLSQCMHISVYMETVFAGFFFS